MDAPLKFGPERVVWEWLMTSAVILYRKLPHSFIGSAGRTSMTARHESGGVRTERGGEPDQTVTPAYRAGWRSD